MSFSAALVAPFSEWITYLYVVAPMLAFGVGAAALVFALGKKVTSRPILRPDLVQPWLYDDSGASSSTADGLTEPLLSGN
jgi:hypothetical protein